MKIWLLRSLKTSYLWLQDGVARKRLGVLEGDGKQNLVDLLTKPLPVVVSEKRSNQLVLRSKSGRPSLVPSI